MYFTMCSMLMMYFKMAVQHSSVENIRCYIVGYIQTFSIMILQENT